MPASDYSRSHVLRYVASVNVNATGDTPVYVPFAKFVVQNAYTTNASTSLAATSATLGLYTNTAAGGTALVTAATGALTPLTSAAIVNPLTIANRVATSGQPTGGTGQGGLNTPASPVAGGTIYVNVGVAHGSAATVDVVLEITRLV